MRTSVVGVLLLLSALACLSWGKSRPKRYRDCREERLSTREEKSDVILTGTIQKVDRIHDGQEYGADILIKRVIKGEELSKRPPPLPVLPNQVIRVEGFGSPKICDNQVTLRDTRIFLISVHQGNRLRLNGTLLRITVPNLERVTAVARGETYKRSVVVDEPCEKKYCPFGAECFEQGERAICKCPTECPIGYAPVCGSNGITYPNECTLRKEACKKKHKIFVKHHSLCSGSRIVVD